MKHAVGIDSCEIKCIPSLIKIGIGAEKFKDTHTHTHTHSKVIS
jgi:hypothetical protein